LGGTGELGGDLLLRKAIHVVAVRDVGEELVVVLAEVFVHAAPVIIATHSENFPDDHG
jgi:hypothetical protein